MEPSLVEPDEDSCDFYVWTWYIRYGKRGEKCDTYTKGRTSRFPLKSYAKKA